MESSTDSIRRPIVWIVNRGGHNYDPAKQFGALYALTTGTVNHFNVDRLAVTLAAAMEKADKDDYLLVSGAPMINALALNIWLNKFGVARTLQFSTKEEQYIPRVLYARTLSDLVKKVGE